MLTCDSYRSHSTTRCYTIRDSIHSIEKEKDLGIHVTRDLKSEEQCTQSARKAQAVLGMVKRHFKELDKEDFMVIYKAYIRPHLEYCVQAWSPHLIKDRLPRTNSETGDKTC